MENKNANMSHPDSYNTGNPDNPTISYEEYIKNKEDGNNAINQSTNNA